MHPSRRLRFTAALWLAGLALAMLATGGLAQTVGDGRRIYQEELRVQLDKQQVGAKAVGVDVGGWLTFGLFDYEDTYLHASGRRKGKVRTLRQYELRLWTSLTFAGVHEVYARGLFSYEDWNRTDNPANRGDDFDSEVERLWYRFDYNRLVRNRTGRDPDLGFAVQVGREYQEIGSGLVLALPLDAVRLTVTAGNWEVTGLVGKTVTHTPNIDDSAVVSDHMDRNFYGVEVRYTGLDHHQPYIYYLWQRDHTREWGNDTARKYTYDSDYLGIGSKGSLLLPNLRYTWELAFESGRSPTRDGTARRERIHAWAMDVQLEYFFDAPMRPRVQFEYLWGSGDKDRSTSGTSTIGGNQRGEDNAFNAFGFRDTGLAFAPDIANLHIFQLGLSANPLERIELFRKMEVGTKVYFYVKDHASGAISDTGGTLASSWVGWEWDVFCNWRITSDLSFTARGGFFQAGDAFDNRECRHFVYTGLTYSF